MDGHDASPSGGRAGPELRLAEDVDPFLPGDPMPSVATAGSLDLFEISPDPRVPRYIPNSSLSSSSNAADIDLLCNKPLPYPIGRQEIGLDGGIRRQWSIHLSLKENLLEYVDKEVLPRLWLWKLGQANLRSNAASDADGGGYEKADYGQGPSYEFVSPSLPSRRDRKRKKTPQDHDSDENDSNDSVVLVEPILEQDTQRYLACHFHKYDPEKFRNHIYNSRQYKTCTNGFESIKNLKEHYTRVHRRDFACWTCCTTFKEEADLQSHLQMRPACDFRPDPEVKVEYIVTDERRKVFNKKSTKSSADEHWYLMWYILYPGCDPPPSPYLCDGASGREAATLGPQWDRAVDELMPGVVDRALALQGLQPSSRAAVELSIRGAIDVLRHQLLHGTRRFSRESHESPEQFSDDSELLTQSTELEVKHVQDAKVSSSQADLGTAHKVQSNVFDPLSAADVHFESDILTLGEDWIDWDAEMGSVPIYRPHDFGHVS